MDNQWKASGKTTAVVFIHGVGIQDRYQQLADFSAGVKSKGVEYKGKISEPDPKGPLGSFHLFEAATKSDSKHSVHVYEVFWGPLLNGLTSPLSVILWGITTIRRTLPWNKKRILRREERPNRQKSSFGKWLWQAGYFSGIIALALVLFLWLLGSFLLASDRLLFVDQQDQQTTGVTISEPAAQEEQVKAKDVGLDRFMPEPVNNQGEKVAPIDGGSFEAAPMSAWAGFFLEFPKTIGYTFERNRGLTYPYAEVGSALAKTGAASILWALAYALAWFWIVLEALTYLLRAYRGGVLKLPSMKLFFGLLVVFGLPAAGISVDLILTHLFMSGALFFLVYRGLKFALSDIAGDVEIYTARNENNKKYKGREEVLTRATGTLRKILDSERYDSVVVVGHSLGSVIGLEALRRLFTDYTFESTKPEDGKWYEKLSAFVTIGSPLEKTLMFFGANDYKSKHAEFSLSVDERMFCAGPLLEPGATAPTPINDAYHIPWFNFWYWADIVADPLSSYAIRPEHETYMGRGGLLWCHSDYWTDAKFVDRFWDVTLAKNPDSLKWETGGL